MEHRVFWILLSLGLLVALPLLAGYGLHLYIFWSYLPVVPRIFQEKPLFIIPRGQPIADAEDVTVVTPDGVPLKGCYLKTPQPRRGVVLFGLEFGSNRWSCATYCDFLRDAGYDVFTFEMRGQGDTPTLNGYEPLQWVTDYEVVDFRAALEHLKQRPDRDPNGIGFFGLSKGGSAGLIAAADEPFVRCFVTDGAFGTFNTMVPYMRKFIQIYTREPWLARLIPNWYYGVAARAGVRIVARERKCRYPSLERAMAKLAPRPFLMIHGGADNYIKPDMAQSLFDLAGQPKELWLVDKAKHNQAIHLAADEYKRRVLEFFDKHLASAPTAATV